MAKVNIVNKKRPAAAAPPKGAAPKAPPPRRTTALVETGKGGLPADMEELLEQHAGQGVSDKPEDNLVPMITILQDNTPQAKKKDQKYIEGCEPGQIWLKGSSREFVEGEEGVVVQPCAQYRAYVEWRPRDNGGGFIATYPEVPKEAKEVRDPKNQNKVKWVMPNGNDVIDTRYVVVRVFMDDESREEYVIPFTSTGHSIARNWNSMRRRHHLRSGAVAPSFSRVYRLTTDMRQNSAGSWFVFNVQNVEGWCTETDVMEGLALYNAFNKGEKAADMRTAEQEEGNEEAM